MNQFEFFCFVKNALVAANKADWTHQPEHDRFIDGELLLCFAKFHNEKVAMTLDLNFDMDAENILKSGEVKLTIDMHDMNKTMRGVNVPNLTINKFFDPVCIAQYQDINPNNYFMKGQDL